MRHLIVFIILMSLSTHAHAENFDADDFMNSIRLDQDFFNGDMKRNTLNDFKGKVVVLAFWGSWCPPCVKEMPSLDRLQRDMSAENIEVVAVSVKQKGGGLPKPMLDDVTKFYKKYNINNLKKYVDYSSELISLHNLSGKLPAAVLLDKNGGIIKRQYGIINWDDETIRNQLRGYLAK